MVRTVAAKGYDETTVEQVAAAAGVSVAVFEALFPSKEECFLAAHEAMVDVLFVRVSSAYDQAGEAWPGRVVAGLRALLELLAEETEVVRMAMLEVSAVGERARLGYRRSIDRFLPLLEAGADSVPGGEELPKDTARLAIGSASSLIFDEVRADRGAELPRLLPQLSFVALMPYLGTEGAEEALRGAGLQAS